MAGMCAVRLSIHVAELEWKPFANLPASSDDIVHEINSAAAVAATATENTWLAKLCGAQDPVQR